MESVEECEATSEDDKTMRLNATFQGSEYGVDTFVWRTAEMSVGACYRLAKLCGDAERALGSLSCWM